MFPCVALYNMYVIESARFVGNGDDGNHDDVNGGNELMMVVLAAMHMSAMRRYCKV